MSPSDCRAGCYARWSAKLRRISARSGRVGTGRLHRSAPRQRRPCRRRPLLSESACTPAPTAVSAPRSGMYDATRNAARPRLDGRRPPQVALEPRRLGSVPRSSNLDSLPASPHRAPIARRRQRGQSCRRTSRPGGRACRWSRSGRAARSGKVDLRELERLTHAHPYKLPPYDVAASSASLTSRSASSLCSRRTAR